MSRMMKPLPIAPMRQSRRMGGGGMWLSSRLSIVRTTASSRSPLGIAHRDDHRVVEGGVLSCLKDGAPTAADDPNGHAVPGRHCATAKGARRNDGGRHYCARQGANRGTEELSPDRSRRSGHVTLFCSFGIDHPDAITKRLVL